MYYSRDIAPKNRNHFSKKFVYLERIRSNDFESINDKIIRQNSIYLHVHK